MPHILVRFMSIKKASMVKKSAIVAIAWVVLSLGAVIVIAVLGRMLVGEQLFSKCILERPVWRIGYGYSNAAPVRRYVKVVLPVLFCDMSGVCGMRVLPFELVYV